MRGLLRTAHIHTALVQAISVAPAGIDLAHADLTFATNGVLGPVPNQASARPKLRTTIVFASLRVSLIGNSTG
jgi:hypothetical protein